VQENIRQEALNALAKLAMADPRFVVDLVDDSDADLNAKLARYGFSLNEAELEEVREFQRRVQSSPEGVAEVLRYPRRVYGFWRGH
jgi:hypothetical protein